MVRTKQTARKRNVNKAEKRVVGSKAPRKTATKAPSGKNIIFSFIKYKFLLEE
jgi:hypothetical protein